MGLAEEVTVEAEIYCPNSNEPIKTYLLGSDGRLYGYNNFEHLLNPFGQEPKNLIHFSKEEIDRIRNHCEEKYPDGKIVKKKICQQENDSGRDD